MWQPGWEFGGEQIHVYVWLSPSTIHLRLTQHCSSAICCCSVTKSCLFAIPWTPRPATHQASSSFIISQFAQTHVHWVSVLAVPEYKIVLKSEKRWKHKIKVLCWFLKRIEENSIWASYLFLIIFHNVSNAGVEDIPDLHGHLFGGVKRGSLVFILYLLKVIFKWSCTKNRLVFNSCEYSILTLKFRGKS